MLRKIKTVIAASVAAALLVGAVAPAIAAEGTPTFTLPPVSGSDDPAGDTISNKDAFVTVPTGTLPCEGGVAVMRRAAAAANGKIAAVNEQADKVGREISAKRSCLENINALINLSMPNFTSLSAILSKIAASIINALINKACAAVVGAINGAVNTINKEIQGVKDQVMAPITDIRNQANGVGGGTSGGNTYVTPGNVSSAVGSLTGSTGGTGGSSSSSASKIQSTPGATTARSVPAQQGTAPSNVPSKAAPAAEASPGSPASAPTPAWKAVSCKIFGGC